MVPPGLSGGVGREVRQSDERVCCRFPAVVAAVVLGTALDNTVALPPGASDAILFLELVEHNNFGRIRVNLAPRKYL